MYPMSLYLSLSFSPGYGSKHSIYHPAGKIAYLNQI